MKIKIGRLHHIIELLILVELAFFLGSGVLILLVFRDEVVHVGLCLSELHLVHALASVPVKEGLAAEHAGELLGYALEHFLDGGGVALLLFLPPPLPLPPPSSPSP